MVKAWAKAAVAGAALMMGAPVWGGGAEDGFDEIRRSGHWTFENLPAPGGCIITGYANPNDIYSGSISLASIYTGEGDIFSAALILSEKTYVELEKNGDTDFGFAFLPPKGDDNRSIGWYIGSRPIKHDGGVFIESGPLRPFRDIAEATNTNIVRVFGGRNRILAIPLPDDFFELAENCMDEDARREAELYGTAK